MPSALAVAFSQSHTADAYRAWLKAEPAAAGDWLRRVSASTAAETVAGVDDFLAAPTAEKLEALVGLVADLEARALGDLQAARAGTLKWTAGRGLDPPPITGVVSIENNYPILTTATGERFTIMNSSAWNNGPDGGHDYHVTIGRDVMAWVGRTVTVRGWPDASYRPGAPNNRLLVEDFDLGQGDTCTQGRLVVQGDEVWVRTLPGKQVKVLDPELREAVKAYDMLGIVLPDPPVERDGVLVYEGTKGRDYWILGGFAWANQAVRTGDGKVDFQLQLAHGKAAPIELDATAWDNGPPRSARQYFYGHFENGVFKASEYSAPCEAWDDGLGGQHVLEAPSSRFVARAVPLDAQATALDYAPRGTPRAQKLMPGNLPMWNPADRKVSVDAGVVTATVGSSTAGHLYGGPYQNLEPGRYRVDFSLRGLTDPTGASGFIEAYDHKSDRFYARQEVQVGKTEGFVRYRLEFDVPPGQNNSELRFWWNGNSTIQAGQIALTRL